MKYLEYWNNADELATFWWEKDDIGWWLLPNNFKKFPKDEGTSDGFQPRTFLKENYICCNMISTIITQMIMI